MTIEVSGYILIPENELEDLLPVLQEHIKLTLEEEGCLEFNITPDSNIKNKFYVFERFQDQNAFDLHQELIKNRAWGLKSKNVERHYTQSV